MKRRGVAVAGLLLLALTAAGCASMSAAPVQPGMAPGGFQPAPGEEPAPPNPAPAPPRPDWVTPVTDANFADLVTQHHPNEMGKVLILEYHHFGDKEERWTRRWDHFRGDLEMLYAKGYRAVNLRDYLAGSMKLPAGASPVIFTFDDSPVSQFQWKDGGPDPQSAVGIMVDFARQHPDFGQGGTFYVNFTPVPFREETTWRAKIRYLADHGFEVANHTSYHDDLGQMTDQKVREALASQVARLREVLPEYDGSTLALPFGLWPKNHQLAVHGEYQGVTYDHRAVLLVGAEPAPSLYDQRFDPNALPRVQAIDSEFQRWLPYLEQRRYVSDGDPATIVLPETEAAHLGKVPGLMVRMYKP